MHYDLDVPAQVDTIDTERLQADAAGVTTDEANRLRSKLRKLMNKPWKLWFPKVAISYATSHRFGTDAPGTGPGMMRAAAIIHQLHNAGIACASGLCVPPGANWKEFLLKIESPRAQCELLIVLLSRAFYRSRPCLEEVHRAVKKGMTVLPLRCEEGLPDKDEQWKNVFDDSEGDEQVVDMITQVKNALGKINSLPPPENGCFFDNDEHLVDLVAEAKLTFCTTAVVPWTPASSERPRTSLLGRSGRLASIQVEGEGGVALHSLAPGGEKPLTKRGDGMDEPAEGGAFHRARSMKSRKV